MDMSPGKAVLKKSVALVGMMGAGKTSIGKRLASRLDVGFCDADHEIEAAAGMTVAEIFAKYGEPEFRRLERCVIARILGEAPLWQARAPRRCSSAPKTSVATSQGPTSASRAANQVSAATTVTCSPRGQRLRERQASERANASCQVRGGGGRQPKIIADHR